MADATCISMILLWRKLLEKTASDSPLAFPDFDGKEVTHLERKIDAAARGLGHRLPTATAFRKQVEIRNKRLSGAMRESVSRALSHSLMTAQQYYQAPTLSDIYGAYTIVQDIIAGARAGSPTKEQASGRGAGDESKEAGEERESAEPGEREGGKHGRELPKAGEVHAPCHRREGFTKPAPRANVEQDGGESGSRGSDGRERVGRERDGREKDGREHDGRERDGEEGVSTPRDLPGSSSPRPRQRKKGFTKRQCALLADHFSTHISTRSFPTTVECREFVAMYKAEFEDRSPKDIYDKCRNMAGRK